MYVMYASLTAVFPFFRVTGVIGVDVAKEEKRSEPIFSGEEDPVEDLNDNSPII